MKTTKKGFTLIEILVVTVLIGILGAVGSTLLSQGFKSYFTAKTITDAVNRVNAATDNVMRELKNAASMSVIGATTFTFLNQQGQTIVINLNGTTLTRSVNGATAQTLCTQATNVAFAFFDQAFTTTAVAANVRFVTMQVTVTNNGFPYSVMAGTVLRVLLP